MISAFGLETLAASQHRRSFDGRTGARPPGASAGEPTAPAPARRALVEPRSLLGAADARAAAIRGRPRCCPVRRAARPRADRAVRPVDPARGRQDRRRRDAGRSVGAGRRAVRRGGHRRRRLADQSAGGSAIIAVKLASAASLPSIVARPANLQTLERFWTNSTSSVSSTPGSTGVRNFALSIAMK